MQYDLRRSTRAKNTRIVVKPGKIEVIAPPSVSERQIKAFVSAQRDWIESALKRVAEKINAVPSLAPIHYAHGATVPFRGRQIPLDIKYTTAKTLRVLLEAEAAFIVYLPSRLDPEQSSDLIRQGLIRWMKHRAGLEANALIEKYAKETGLKPRSFKIKTQKSRWGSCGPKDDINLNWLLMLAPPEALEYVVVHELCHIKHKNHSNDFWQLVAEYLPDYQHRRRWLKQHGPSLMKGL